MAALSVSELNRAGVCTSVRRVNANARSAATQRCAGSRGRFTFLSGVAPLLMPNPFFPDSVRWVHFCEVTSENFVFGVIVAWLWGKPTLAGSRLLHQAA